MTEMPNMAGKPEDSHEDSVDTGRQDDQDNNERKQGNEAHASAPRHGEGLRPRKQRKQQNAPTPKFEVSPRLWTDTTWEPADEPLEATLALSIEDYLSWLASHRMERTVGVQPSAYENPLSEYLGLVMGAQPRLQTDGRRTWCMLQLTKAMRDTPAQYLRLVLPPWTTPLALEYTAFPVGRTSGRPMQRSVSALEAFKDAQAAVMKHNI